MVQIKPTNHHLHICPECKSNYTNVKEIVFETIHVLADCQCTLCGLAFYQVLPVGHALAYPMSLEKFTGKLYQHNETPSWLATSIQKSHKTTHKDEVNIEKIIYKKHDKVIILNTLDTIYGHVLLKLYNAFYHLKHQKEFGLIIIIPKIFKWLIPKGCAEVWLIDLSLDKLTYSYSAIQKFIDTQLLDFKEIHLSNAYSHPNLNSDDIEILTGLKTFKLENFTNQKPCITFILREDRWWFQNKLDYWFYRISRKLKFLSWSASLLTQRQNKLIKRTITLLKKKFPLISINVIGIGKTGDFNGYAQDERVEKLNQEIEKNWCRIYAKSHVVIGIHGSNMLLPTAFAAGCVEILPEDRYGNMIQDITVRYNNRLQLFFYRFVDQFTKPKSVADKAISIIKDFPSFNKNMCLNVYPGHSDDTPLT